MSLLCALCYKCIYKVFERGEIKLKLAIGSDHAGFNLKEAVKTS